MELELIKPYYEQQQVIEAFDDATIFTITVIAGRQAGKTCLAECLAILYCLQNNNKTVLWCSPTDNQAQKVYKEILAVLPPFKTRKAHPYIAKIKGAKGDTEILFHTGSVIHFRSAGSEDTLRGDKNHFIVLDEAAKMKRTTVEEIIIPTQTAVKEPKLLIISTPKGKNWLYEYYENGLNNITHPTYKSLHFTCYDSPYTNKVFIEEKKNNLTDLAFRQEYLAEFVDNASAFKNVYECATLEKIISPDLTDKYYAGVDVGLLTDSTVLSIVNSNGFLVHYYKWERLESATIQKAIIEANRIWNFKKILFETNNHGLPIYQDLQKQLNNIENFNTNSKTKPEIISNLINLFDKKTIRVVNDEEVKKELNNYNYKIMPTGSVKYGAIDGEHDDIVMSFAIARRCYEQSRFNSDYLHFYG